MIAKHGDGQTTIMLTSAGQQFTETIVGTILVTATLGLADRDAVRAMADARWGPRLR